MQPTDILTQAIWDGLRTVFREVLENPTLKLTPATSAVDIPEWDSFNHISLIVAVEARFGVKFQTAELESMSTVGALARVIQEKLALQGR